MAITLKEFEDDSFFTSKTANEIMDFLKKNFGKAFTSKEIAEALGKASVVNIGSALKRLRKGGFIVRNHPYIALSAKISPEKLGELKEAEAKRDERRSKNYVPGPGRPAGSPNKIPNKKPILGQEIDEVIVGEQVRKPIPIKSIPDISGDDEEEIDEEEIDEEESEEVEPTDDSIDDDEEFPEGDEEDDGPELAKDYQ